jgi:uncharacterized protein YhbP (UPF0306 family)
MQLATVSGDQPWACTVHFAVDNLHNLYWLSNPSRRHSQDIAKNPKVAAAIVLPETAGKIRGMSVQGVAWETTDPKEIEQHIVAFEERFGRHGVGAEIISGKNANRLYQLKPEFFVLFDTINFPSDPRQEWRVAG